MPRQRHLLEAPLLLLLLVLASVDGVLAGGRETAPRVHVAPPHPCSRASAYTLGAHDEGCITLPSPQVPVINDSGSCGVSMPDFPTTVTFGQTITFHVNTSASASCLDPKQPWVMLSVSYMDPSTVLVDGKAPPNDRVVGPPEETFQYPVSPGFTFGTFGTVTLPPGSHTVTLTFKSFSGSECMRLLDEGGVVPDAQGPWAVLWEWSASTGTTAARGFDQYVPFQINSTAQISLTDSVAPSTAKPGDVVTFTLTARASAPVTNGKLEEALPFPVPLGARIEPGSITPTGKVEDATFEGKKYPAGILWTFSGAGPFTFSFQVRLGSRAALEGAFDLGAVWDEARASATVSGGSTSTTAGAQALVIYDKKIHVTLTSDASADNAERLPASNLSPPSDVTLRSALEFVNAHPGERDTVEFDVKSGGSNQFDGDLPIITPASALPAVSQPITLDGGGHGGPGVELDGAAAGPGVDGLSLSGEGSTVTGMVISRFSGAGISLNGGGSSFVTGNYLGTNAAGDGPVSSSGIVDYYPSGNRFGIYVNSSGNRIGGISRGDGNLISGNRIAGIWMQPSGNGTVVEGNIVGLDLTGMKPIPNGDGIVVGALNGVAIGGKAKGAGNLISGNEGWVEEGTYGTGVHVLPGSTDNRIQGNRIGLDATGEGSVPNGFYGLQSGGGASLAPSGGVVVEGDRNSVGPDNVIAGNLVADVYVGGLLDSGSNPDGAAPTGNVVQGNFLGVDEKGARVLRPDPRPFGIHFVAVPEVGVAVGGSQNTIGGAGSLGNVAYGVHDLGEKNVIQGNLVGLAAGAKPLHLTGYIDPHDGLVDTGILVGTGATVGGPGRGEGNWVTGVNRGIEVGGPDCVVQGNFIGADASLKRLGGKQSGIDTLGVLIDPEAGGALVGGTQPGQGNVIAYCGVDLVGEVGFFGGVVLASSGSQVVGNTIVLNSVPGVYVTGLEPSPPAGNSILSNEMWQNTWQGADVGILLEDYRFSPSWKPGSGPNNYLNYPEQLTGALNGKDLVLSGRFVGGPAFTKLMLQVFSNGPSAQKLVASTTITTDLIGGVDSFSVSIPKKALINVGGPNHPAADVTVTATDAEGDTSQFSPVVHVALK